MVFGLGLGISYTTRLQPVVLQLLSYTRRSGMTLDTTRLQPVVLQIYRSTHAQGDNHRAPSCSTLELEFVAQKLKYHRLKPRGVPSWLLTLFS
jgi:hypothetical protein